MPAKDADALLLQVSADIRGLEKQMAKAVGVVNSGSKTMEDRASKFVKTFGNANDNAVAKLSHGVGTAVGDNIRNLAQGAGQASTVLDGFGIAGVAAAAGVGALVAVMAQAREAIAFGDAIADASQNAGVSTDTLQELRFAVHATGGEYEDADGAITAFTQKLGQAESGNAKALKTFKQLGFTQADLKGFASADEALHAIMQRVSELGKESERQAIAEKLGLTPMIGLLREGADAADALRQKAHDLGYVLDSDLVASAGDANDQLEDLQSVIKVQLTSALIDVAPLLLGMAGGLASAAKGTRGLFDEIAGGFPTIDAFIGKIPALQNAISLLYKYSGLKTQVEGLKSIGIGRDWSSMESPDRSFKVDPPKPRTLGDLGGGGSAPPRAAKSLTPEQKAAKDGRFAGGPARSIVVNTDTVEFTETPDVFTPKGGLSDYIKEGGDNFKKAGEIDDEGLVRYLSSLQDIDAEMHDAGVQAIDDLSSGLADALVNAHSLGSVAANVFKQIEVQILEILIRAAATKAASLFGFSEGGYLGGFASGGRLLRGPGTGTSDSILATNGKGKFARFSDGEFISTASATRKHRALLEAINSGEIDRYASGGLVGGFSPGAMSAGGAQVVQQFFPNFSGAVMTEDLMQQFKSYADGRANQAAMQGAQGGAALARQQIQKSATNRLSGRRR